MLSPFGMAARRQLFEGRCAYCATVITRSDEDLDHGTPLSRGGTNWPENLFPACSHCNLSKNALTVEEYLRRRHRYGLLINPKLMEILRFRWG